MSNSVKTFGLRQRSCRLLIALSAIAHTAAASSAEPFAKDGDGIRAAFPDLTQTDPAGGFARGGKSFCGPVAVSNSLTFLYRADLARDGLDQYDLVDLLASGPYMKTDPVKGLLQMTGGMHIKKGATHAILDGAVALRFDTPAPSTAVTVGGQ